MPCSVELSMKKVYYLEGLDSLSVLSLNISNVCVSNQISLCSVGEDILGNDYI